MNNYHIYEKIGKGQHSVVYKGRKKQTIHYYAIKSVDKSQKSRVMQEVRTMHALKHRNILQFFAWYETTNHLWLILEYCVGGDLLSLLKVDTRLPESSVHDFARDLVIALQYLHHNSTVYCDLKPSNILLDENGRLKLGGFGLSRRLSDINRNPLVNLPEPLRGTPVYMAPELFSEGATHSTASDLWALGCVIYECSTGKPPFMNASLQQLVSDILDKEPAPVEGASAQFTHFLGRLLDKNPATRMNWKEMVAHPFFEGRLPWLDMPEEPALQAFIQRNNLAPQKPEPIEHTQANERARAMRQSVDITRLSRIALNNLEKESDVRQARASDIHLDNADTELTFQELGDEGTEDEEAAASADEGSAIDHGTTHHAADSSQGRVDLGDAMSAQQQGHLGDGPTQSASRPETASQASSELGGRMQAATLDDGMGSGEEASVDALMWHATDTGVKPIVANRRIERLPEPRWEARSLGFPALTLEQMMALPQAEKEQFLTQIYRAVASTAPLKDKVNVLAYFETLCCSTDAANILLNSCLATLFVKLLKSGRAPTLRIRLASVLGLLVRHATFISTDNLAPTGVVEVLTEAVQDRNERVKRRVMATLGELLFYIATQQQEAAASTASALSVHDTAQVWGISQPTTAVVVRLLKPGEDEITQHYAVKTIENICSHGGEWAARFCTADVAAALAQIYLGHKAGEHLVATAASTLSRVLRNNPALLAPLIDRCGAKLVVAGLRDSSSKVQGAAVNILNLALLHHADLSPRTRQTILEERELLPAVLKLLDHAALVLRGKACCCLLLLFRLSPRWLAEACRLKVVPMVEGLHREVHKQLQQLQATAAGGSGAPDNQEAVTLRSLASTAAALREEVGSQVPRICSSISQELTKLVPSTSTSTASPRTPSPRTSALSHLAPLLHLVSSTFFRPAVVSRDLVEALASYVSTAAAAPAAAAPALQEFNTSLTHIIEAVCQTSEVVVQQHEALLELLLPALCRVVAAAGVDGDQRFFCLRMVSEVVQHLYPAPAPEQDPEGTAAAAAGLVDRVLREHVLPLMPTLLAEEDPMPLWALKMLGGLLEGNVAWAGEVAALGLAPQLFAFLSLDHPNNNVHNIKLCRHLVAARVLPPEELLRLHAPEKVTDVYGYAYSNAVEPFLEPVLALCHAIIDLASAAAPHDPAAGSLLAPFLRHLPSFVTLCTHADPCVATVAAATTSILVALYPEWATRWMISDDGVSMLVPALELNPSDPDMPPPNPQVQQQLLEALASALQPERTECRDPEPPHTLACICRQIAEQGTPELSQVASEVADLLARISDSAAV